MEQRIEYYNQYYGFKYNKINIKNQKTRWGSCSKKGNLNFNYKILFLSAETRDYIVVHELCHLKEFNHSKKFWNLVAETIPNYLQIRKNLKLR
jgi:predicted metal-dependent hydrolase